MATTPLLCSVQHKTLLPKIHQADTARPNSCRFCVAVAPELLLNFPVLGSVPSCRESMETTTTTATEMTACCISHYMRKDGGPQDPRVLMPHGDLPWLHFKISHVTRSCRPNEQGEHCAAFVRHGAGDGPVWQLRSLVLCAETRCTLVLPRVLAELLDVLLGLRLCNMLWSTAVDLVIDSR